MLVRIPALALRQSLRGGGWEMEMGAGDGDGDGEGRSLWGKGGGDYKSLEVGGLFTVSAGVSDPFYRHPDNDEDDLQLHLFNGN